MDTLELTATRTPTWDTSLGPAILPSVQQSILPSIFSYIFYPIYYVHIPRLKIVMKDSGNETGTNVTATEQGLH